LSPRLTSFIGSQSHQPAESTWFVTKMTTICGEDLPGVSVVQITPKAIPVLPAEAVWRLHGVSSNLRYTTRGEKQELTQRQVALGRPEATRGVLIPIRKNSAWWDLTQEERREIFEEQSRHTTIGLKYLPAIARKLHHCRDLGSAEPFDFVTQFDFAPADEGAFDDLLEALRGTLEWTYIDREVEIRLTQP
jgi:Chlorite dismutase